LAENQACCAPARDADAAAANACPSAVPAAEGRHTIEQLLVPSQTFRMGDHHGDDRGDGETPVHEVTLRAFHIDATPVTNRDFAEFAGDSGYVTDAEQFGFSAVFHLAVAADRADIIGPAAGTPWWIGVHGADWAHPGGPRSSIGGLEDHPVVHVTWRDAVAYCTWAGRGLPTEAQWECAARGGITGARFPWGDELGTELPCNIWQGPFPRRNTGAGGWFSTAPVRSYRPNAYGLWQPIGNVWEWCADWWDADYYAVSSPADPAGPAAGERRVLRGGSYLCHDSYCNRYRNSARSANTPDSSMANAGFRTIATRSAKTGPPSVAEV
jgi:sulfatase modifying factor 1